MRWSAGRRAYPFLPFGFPRADHGELFDAARMRPHDIVILGMKTWLPTETLKGLRQAEGWRRRDVRLHFQVLERFREQRRREAEQPRLGKVK
jgi:hypothetical protein